MKKNDKLIVISNDISQEEKPTLTCKDMRALYPAPKRKSINAVLEIEEYMKKIVDFYKLEKKAKKDREAIQAFVMQYMGEHDTLKCGKKVLATWKSKSLGQLDVVKLKTQYPEIYKECMKRNPTRYFVLGK